MNKLSLLVCGFFLLISLVKPTSVYSQPVSNGSAGALTVSGTQIINTYGQVSNIYSGGTIGVYGYNFSPAVGDKVLLVQMTGANTGRWEWEQVTSGGDPFIISNSNLTGFSTAYGGIVQAILVPQYTSLTIPAGATLTAAPWNGTTGGILTFMVKNNLTILPGGKCDVSGLGYVTGTGGVGATGGAGGAAGAGGSIGLNGGDSLVVLYSGVGSGGNGGILGGLGGSVGNPTLRSCISCRNTAGAGGTNLSSLAGGLSGSTLVFGGAGQAGAGGSASLGAGGGGGGGAGGQNGTAGNAGGSGGGGGIGGTGGGIIVFLTDSLTIPTNDTVFKAIGTNGSAGLSGNNGGNGGDGGLGGSNCNGGGGGAGANGGSGGNGGGGGGGGAVLGILFNSCQAFGSSTVQSNGGLGAAGGAGGSGGTAGINAGPGNSCAGGGPGGSRTAPPDGTGGAAGTAGANGDDGGGGGSSGAVGSSVVTNCNVNPITQSGGWLNQTVGFGCGNTYYNSSAATLGISGGVGALSINAYPNIINNCYAPYTILVTDSRGCTANFNGSLTEEYLDYDINITSTTNTSCPYRYDGTCSYNIFYLGTTTSACAGGWQLNIIGPNGYTYYNSGNFPSSGNILSGLAPGVYNCTVTSSCNFNTAGSFTILAGNTPVHGGESATICNGSSYLWNGTSYSQAGSYNYTFPGAAAYGCDSIATLHLAVLNPISQTAFKTICFNTSYQIGNHSYSSSGTYLDTLTTTSGCDSIVTLNLTVSPAITNSLATTICAGQVYTLGGHSHISSGTYTDTLTTTGCDSIVTLNLTVSPAITNTVTATICAGQNYIIGTSSYTQSGTYVDTLIGASISGCDSIVTLNLAVNPIAASHIYDTICSSSSVTFGSHSYSQGGTYIDTIRAAAVSGCDSMVTLHLSIYPTPSVSLYDTLSQGHSITIAGRIYSQSGVYTDTVASSHGCDSVIHLYLLVEDSFTFAHLFDTICQGFSVALGGHSYTVSGTYLDTLHGVFSDTLVTLNLTVNNVLPVNVYDTICGGHVVTVAGHSYTQSGVYIDTLTGRLGCDSVQVLHLTVIPSVSPSISISVSHGPVIAGMETDTFRASYAYCVNPYISWYQNITPLGIHTSTAVVTFPQGEQDSILCRIDCQNECATASFVFSNSIFTAINQISMIKGVNIYPNPTHGSFTVDIDLSAVSSKSASLSVTDLVGQVLMSNSLSLHSGNNKQVVTLGDNLVAGVYIVQLSIDGQSAYYRIVLDK